MKAYPFDARFLFVLLRCDLWLEYGAAPVEGIAETIVYSGGTTGGAAFPKKVHPMFQKIVCRVLRLK